MFCAAQCSCTRGRVHVARATQLPRWQVVALLPYWPTPRLHTAHDLGSTQSCAYLGRIVLEGNSDHGDGVGVDILEVATIMLKTNVELI